MTRKYFKALTDVAAALGVLAGTASHGFAIPITYTEQVIGSGTLGGVPFTNDDVQITMNADTTGVVQIPGESFNTGSSVTISIGGGAPANVTDPFHAFDVNDINLVGTSCTLACAGFGGLNAPFFVFPLTENSAFSSYFLDTDIGPITGPSQFTVGSLATSEGPFDLVTVAGNCSVFQAGSTPPAAITGCSVAVTEPPSLTVVATSLLLLSFFGIRRKANRR